MSSPTTPADAPPEDLRARPADEDEGAFEPMPDLQEEDDPEREVTSTVALFEGDEGGLELAQRKALVALLKQRFISNATHPREWRALVANPRPIRARLNDLFLELHLDRDREVALKRQVLPEGGGRFPTLLYDAAWSREETIALVYLRSRYRREQATGARRAFVDKDDILAFIAQHRPEHATDESGDARRAERAVEAVHRTGLLVGASTDERFEISNAIEVLLPLPRLTELLRWLQEQNATSAATPAAAECLGTADADAEADAEAGASAGTADPDESEL